RMGYDSDHPMARGEVGKVGVAIDTLADMETLFDSIPLDKVSTSMTINSTAAVLLAMYCTVAKKQGAEWSKLSGTIQNDLLKEYIARGTYIYPPAASMKIITDIFAWCAKEIPSWNTISISGYHIREAGSTAVQEVAFTLSNAIAYVQAALDAGLDIDEFAPRLAFFFNAHNNLFEEVAKFRAARRIYAKLMRERFGAKSDKSWTLRFHTQTAGSSLQAQQPYVNVIRTTVQAMAAVLGGTQSLHTNSFDEALALPTDESATLALRTQQVIGYESGVTETIDPLGGSYYVESLTDQIETAAMEYIKKIDAMGGSVPAIEKNFFQTEIAAASYAYQQAIERGDKKIVGVNSFRDKETPPPPVLKVTEEQERSQVEHHKQIKANRDNAAVNQRLEAVEQAARNNENIMPYIVAAVEVYASVGEISDALRRVYGEY
ncbi:MAG: methylmalonyl-CoA mutase family protein, partial [bacterium]|nr:methylmalonyl-CoA mutase family protein [bacterium]